MTPAATQRWPLRRARRGAAAAVLVLTTALVATLALPAAAQAATTVVAAPASLNEVINNIRNWIMGILIALATLFLTVGGLRYLMAGGDPGEVTKAKAALKSAAIGYGLAALAPLLTSILRQIVSA